MKLNKLKLQKGFTIIEVMIVLAIAGLIMVIVFLAVPQLQRSQRNTSRKSVVNRIKTEIDNFSSNNTGTVPVATDVANTPGTFGDVSFNATFAGKYFTGIDISDPQTGGSLLASTNLTLHTATDNDSPPSGVGKVLYDVGAVCKGEVATTTGASGRNYALLVNLEGKSVYCVDNH